MIVSSCEQSSKTTEKGTSSKTAAIATVEIPAGKLSSKVKSSNPNGFLPYPGNFGFVCPKINSTKADRNSYLDVLILAESLEKGTKLGIIPVAMLLLEENGIEKRKIIAVPSDEKLQVMQLEDFGSFITTYNAVQILLQEWFLNSKGIGKTKLIGWKDDKYTKAIIEEYLRSKTI